jgi:L-threonylcarbamoyladenylate synthase
MIRMQTLLTGSAFEAAEFIRDGGIVAFPTETVYGLGADIFNGSAVARIFEAKRRPADNPLIVHIAYVEQISELAAVVTDTARGLMDAFFPGPLTVVLKKHDSVPGIATAGLETVGIRMPRSPQAHEFLVECNTPIAAPSANLSGRPSPTTWQAVYEDLDGRIDCILQGEPTEIGIESTVVDCTGQAPVVLRLGTVSVEQIRAIIPNSELYSIKGSKLNRSPGLRHQHYSPRAEIVIVGDERSTLPGYAYIGISPPPSEMSLVRLCANVDEYIHELFEFFRECDRRGITMIYCERVDDSGTGRALMDRIERAAS